MSSQPIILDKNEYYALEAEARERYIQELVKAYREKGGALKDHHIKFIRSTVKHPSGYDVRSIHAFFMASHFIGIGGAGACVGGIIGAAVGGPAAPATALAGVAIGAAVGGSLGAVAGIGTGYLVAEFKCRPTYKKFCEQKANEKFHAKLKELLQEDRIFDQLCCSISHMPVIEGVRTPAGHLYERVVIEDWIEQSGTDPMTRKPLTLRDLRPAVHTSIKACRTFIKFLIEKKAETIRVTPECAQCYDALITDTRDAFVNVYNTKMRALQKKYQMKEIGYEEFSKQSADLNNKYLTLM